MDLCSGLISSLTDLFSPGAGESSGCVQHHISPAAGPDGGKPKSRPKPERNCGVLEHFNPLLLLLVQVIRSGQKVVGKKAAGGQKQGGGGGFFSSLFGRKAKKEEQEREESKEPESG